MRENDTPAIDRRSFLKATGAAGAAVALGGVGSADGSSAADGETHLVGISASAAAADVRQSMPSNAEVLRHDEDLGFMEVQLPSASTYAEISAASQVQTTPGVKYVEPNATHYAFETPDDPRFSDQYAPQQVRAPTAWDTTEGSADVTIAVVDQGVKYDHPDLQDQFGSNKGKDFVDGDGDPYPDDLQNEYHGTHVAGIASATTNNGTGVAGISDSTLLSGRALSEQGSGSTADIADAVKWAADQGADIVNMSLGGGGYTDTMKNAVSYAVNNGCLPICAAGNSGSGEVSYPAKYDECVAVSAVDENEQLASFSQYGPNLDVAAPGVDVLSTWTTSEYNKISGTSMACPAASGVAALGKAVNPGLSPTELRSLLKETAVDIGLSSEEQGAGRVDAANIVGDGGGGGGGGNEAPSASFTVSDSTVAPGDSVSFDGSGSSDPDGSIAAYDWTFGDGTTATGPNPSHSYDSAGDYTVQLTVTDGDGATDTASSTVTVESSGGGGGGECGDATETVTETGTLDATGDSDAYTYTTQLEGTCGVTVGLSGDSGTDFDLYLTLDGRTPSTYDYDKRSYNYGSDESISVSDSEVGSGQDLGILVDSYSGSGGYTLTIEETGTGGGGGGGGGNEGPSASLSLSAGTVTVGETLSVDGSGSSDPDGSIAAYEWAFGDGTTASGATASHSYGAAGDYTVTLTVTDDDGATDSASSTVTVESDSGGGGGSCGDTSQVASADGSLSSSYDDASYSYTAQLADPCQLTISLDGPYSADFDLYVTTDGRTPSTYDYDKRSVSVDSQEQIIVDDVAAGQEFGILVDSWDGSGNFTVSAEEIGK